MKVSDGGRGAEGKLKVYQIIVEGATVQTKWGKAEKADLRTNVQVLASEGHAMQQALTKLYEKLDRGYTLTQKI
jgi:predicted DNA-binding WGR domain protein